jgi:putative ABC transport system permease protein
VSTDRDRDLDDEIAAHLRMAIEERVKRGESRDAAEAAVRREFGNVTHVKEVTREERDGRRLFESTVQVLRHAIRRLRRSPGYSVPVILSLALGIGLNTAVFSMLSNVLLRPLPFPNQSELITAGTRTHAPKDPPGMKDPTWETFGRDLAAWQNSRSLASAGTFSQYDAMIEGPFGPEQLSGAFASPSLLKVLGVQPLRGRWFAGDERGVRYVVIGYDLWKRQYSGDTNVVGRTLHIHGDPWTIIGVMPRGVGLPLDAEFWIPSTEVGGQLVARPKPGLSLAEVAKDLETSGPGLDNMRHAGFTVQVVVVPLHDQLVRSAGPALSLVAIGALLLLLIACANIANLSLARSLEQRRETAVRIALGARRRSLASLILAENLLLAMVGAVAGAVLAIWATRVLVSIAPAEITSVTDIGIDATSVVIAALLAVGTGLIVSLAPILAASHVTVHPALGENPRQGGGRGFRRFRRALVATQLALTLLLLTGTGMLVRSVQRLTRPDHLGFSPHGVTIATLDLFGSRFRVPGARTSFLNALALRAKALPYVTDVGLGPAPLVGGRGEGLREGFNAIAGYRDSATNANVTFWVKDIDPGYLATYKIHLIAGRAFRETDDSLAPQVALLNAAAARMFFGRNNALDQTLPPKVRFVFRDKNHPLVHIVGIVSDVLQRDLAIETVPEIYLPVKQTPESPVVAVAVRSPAPSKDVVAALQQAIREIDPHVAATRLEPMDAVVSASLARHTFLLYLLSVLSGLAIALSVIGLYAVVSYLVSQRTFEFGLRIALGAQQRNIFGLVFKEAALLVGIGLLVGVPAALGLSKFIAAFLYEVKPHDLVTFASVPILLCVVGFAAAFQPARRAVGVDPAKTLRTD